MVWRRVARPALHPHEEGRQPAGRVVAELLPHDAGDAGRLPRAFLGPQVVEPGGWGRLAVDAGEEARPGRLARTLRRDPLGERRRRPAPRTQLIPEALGRR